MRGFDASINLVRSRSMDKEVYPSSSSSDEDFMNGRLSRARVRPISPPSRASALLSNHGRSTPFRRLSSPASPGFRAHRSTTDRAFVIMSPNCEKDDDNGKMIAALLHWRRQVVLRHFLAWKVVVRRKQYRLTREHKRASRALSHAAKTVQRRYEVEDATLIRMGHLASPPATQSIYTKPFVKQAPKSPNRSHLILDANARIRRREFQASLQLVYFTFSKWKEVVKDLRHEAKEQERSAIMWRRKRSTMAVIIAWRGQVSYRAMRDMQWQTAVHFDEEHLQKRHFWWWKRSWKLSNEVNRRMVIVSNRQLVRCWDLWVNFATFKLLFRRCSYEWQTYQLRCAIKRYKSNVEDLKAKRLCLEYATVHNNQRLRLLYFKYWRVSTLWSPMYLDWVHRASLRYVQTGVRRWRRFIQVRRKRARKQLEADMFSYKCALTKPFLRWIQYLTLKRNYRQSLNRAIKHFGNNITRRALVMWMRHSRFCATKKSKLIEAFDWHQSRKLRLSLRTWHQHAHYILQSRRIRQINFHRRITFVFATWRSWASGNALTHTKMQLVGSRHRKNLMVKIFGIWRKTHALHVVLSTIHNRRSQSMTKHILTVWSDNVISLRRQRILVESVQLKIKLLILARVIREWSDVTKRHRCYRQLIRLFRKKVARKHLRHVFRVLRIGVRWDRYQRQLNKKLAGDTFTRFKAFTAANKSKQASIQLAIEYFYSRRCNFAIRLWRQSSILQSQSRRKTLTAFKHNLDSIMRRVLRMWYRITRNLCKRKILLQTCKLHREQRCSRYVIWSWYIFAQKRHRREQFVRTCISRRQDQSIQFVWDAWIAFLKLRQTSNHMNNMATASNMYRLWARVIKEWGKAAKQQRAIRAQYRMAYESLNRRRLKASVGRWKKVRRRQIAAREQMELAIAFRSEALLCRTLLAWQTFWYSQSMKREQAVTVARILANRKLRLAIRTMYQAHVAGKSAREMSSIARYHHEQVLRRRGILSWSRLHALHCHRRGKQNLAISHYRRWLSKQVFTEWKSYSTTQRTFKRHLFRVFNSDIRFSLPHLFLNWKHYRRSSTLRSTAIRFYSQTLLRRMWTEWVSHHRFVVTINRSALVTDHLRRANMLRTTFYSLKQYLRQRWVRQDQIDMATRFHMYRQRRQCIRRWKGFYTFKQQNHTATVFSESISKRRFMKRWSRYVVLCRQREQNMEKASKWRSDVLATNTFGIWMRLTASIIRSRIEKADALYSRALTKKAWIKWFRIHVRCRISNIIRFRRQASQIRSCWRQWCQYNRSQADRKRKLLDAQMFRKIAKQRQTWSAWLRYIDQKHCRIDQIERAQEHYLFSVLRRRFFAKWHHFTQEMRYHHERVALAAEYVDHARLRSVLTRWMKFWQARQRKKLEYELAQRKLLSQILLRNIGKWREQTKHRKLHRLTLATSAEYCRRRRLSHAIDLLSESKIARKAARQCQKHAQTHRSKTLQLKSLKKWANYLAWRKRNQRLVALFRESRKDDYFSRWKILYRRKKAKRLAVAKATDLLINTTNRRSVTRWVDFVSFRKLKARASKFCIARLQRQHLSLWRHKVSMLKQLRRRVRNYISNQLCIYFSSWKRVVCTRKVRMKNLERATRFMTRSRMEKRWRCWHAFICECRVERAVIQSAKKYRQRFLLWRVFTDWKSRARCRNRKRILGLKARVHFNNRRLQRSMQAWVSWHQSRNVLEMRQVHLMNIIATRRCHQAVQMLKELCIEHRIHKEKIIRAHNFRRNRSLTTCWRRWQEWRRIAQFDKVQNALADARWRRVCQHKYFGILREWFMHCKVARAKLSVFRGRYFSSMLESCFCRWRCTTTLRLKLRVFIQRNQTLRRKELLAKWHQHAKLSVRHQVQWQQAVEHHRSRQLQRWLQHWESVATDRWIARQLTALHERDRGRRLAFQGIYRWREATKCRRESQHATLAAALKRWRAVLEARLTQK